MIWVIILALASFIAGYFIHKYLYGTIQSKNIYTQSKEVIKADTEQLKMLFMVRDDLKMGKGKLAAQCCHAAVALYDMIVKEPSAKGEAWRKTLHTWEEIGAKKVVVRVKDEAELDAVYDKLEPLGKPLILIEDAGLTQIASGSKTVVGIGPCSSSAVDPFTRHLKLL